MSNAAFAECLSPDPVERAIARKAIRILNDPNLNRAQRKTLVCAAQAELIKHRRALSTREALEQLVTGLELPAEYAARTLQIQSGVVRIGAIKKHCGFVWLEVGAAPEALAMRNFTVPLPSRRGTGAKNGGGAHHKPDATCGMNSASAAATTATGSTGVTHRG